MQTDIKNSIQLAENRVSKIVKDRASPGAFAELGCPHSADHKSLRILE
jgi:hypothetical protein